MTQKPDNPPAMMTNEQLAAAVAFEKDRRIKVAGFNGCRKAKEGLYCQSCVAQATNYTYSGEQDRRKSQHIYKRHLPDVNFEYWYSKNCTVDLDLTSAKLGWQASREALMSSLVEARDALDDGYSRLVNLGAGLSDEGIRMVNTIARINAVIGDKK